MAKLNRAQRLKSALEKLTLENEQLKERLKERACCLPSNDWGHTLDCPRVKLQNLRKAAGIIEIVSGVKLSS